MLKIGRYDYGAYGIFSTYAICSLMLPLVMVDIGRDLNFPLDDGGMGKGGTLLLLRSFAMLASLLFCGPLAKRLGKRYTMGLSMLLCGLGVFCAGFSQSFLCLISLLTISGLGEGLCEGIATPFLNDLHRDNPSCYVSIGHSFWSVGSVLAVLMVAGLHFYGLRWRFFLGGAGFLALLSTLPFFLPEQKGKEYPENLTNLTASEAGEGTWERTCKIMRSGKFWLYCAAMFVCAGAELSLSYWAASFIRLTIRDSVSMGAMATACIAAGMFAGRLCYGKYVPQPRLWHLLMSSALAGIPLTLLLLLFPTLYANGSLPPALLHTMLFLLLTLCGLCTAPFWPFTQVYGVLHLPELDSTLLYIYFSCVGVPGSGFFTWLIGILGDRWGVTTAFFLTPLTMLIYVMLMILERNTKKQEALPPLQ